MLHANGQGLCGSRDAARINGAHTGAREADKRAY